MIAYLYRIMSEEAQLGRVVMDLTKMTEAFQSGGKASCSIVSKKKKWCVNTDVMSVCKDNTYVHVSCLFLLAEWIFTISMIDCLYPAITRPLDEESKTCILNRQLELLLFTSSVD